MQCYLQEFTVIAGQYNAETGAENWNSPIGRCS